MAREVKVTTMLSDEEASMLRVASAKKGVSQSAYIRMAMKLAIESEQK